jgi:cytochrome c
MACFRVALVVFLIAGLTASAQSGAFSPEQAKRGEAVYDKNCAACHGTNLEGGQEAPPLNGDIFWSGWDQKTARTLYARVLSTMPPDSPGSIAEKDVIDIVAFVVHANGVPPGTANITNPNELNNIKLERPK